MLFGWLRSIYRSRKTRIILRNTCANIYFFSAKSTTPYFLLLCHCCTDYNSWHVNWLHSTITFTESCFRSLHLFYFCVPGCNHSNQSCWEVLSFGSVRFSSFCNLSRVFLFFNSPEFRINSNLCNGAGGNILPNASYIDDWKSLRDKKK